ncbi:MAG: replication initiator protein [Arizlama microvirus]|nr:MAG: replication initiator protein [Arizlama microvirus]
MSCVNPLKAFQCFDKSIVFDEIRKHDIVRSLSLPCGQCVGCRLERSRQWAMRCMHEAQTHQSNCFITLTYDDTHLPSDGSLHYKDFQLFVKRLRKKFRFNRIRYYMAGEYGENFGRPHFHACLFGIDFHDKKLWKRTPSGALLYRSQDLETLWPFGYSSVGDVNFESAAYVARYIMKKQTGRNAYWHYSYSDLETGEIITKTPEFNKMSLKPGIGADWYEKYKSDVYPHDYVVIRGKKTRPPKAYDKMYKKSNPYEYDELLYNREKNAKLNPDNHDPKRLDAKRQILEQKLSLLKRTLT